MFKRAKVALAVAGALVIGAAPAMAQQAEGDAEGRPGRRGPGLRGPAIESILSRREALGLTDEQVASLEALRDELHAEMQPLREDARREVEEAREQERARMEARRERGEALRERFEQVHERGRQGVEDILTEEQRAELREEMARGHRGPVMRNGRGQERGAPGSFRRGGFGRGSGPAFRGHRGGPGARGFAPRAGFRSRAWVPRWRFRG